MKQNRRDEWPSSEQEIQLLACRSMLSREKLIPISIVEREEPLEKTRLFGPFDLETLAWVCKVREQHQSLIEFGWDADGRSYIEY